MPGSALLQVHVQTADTSLGGLVGKSSLGPHPRYSNLLGMNK